MTSQGKAFNLVIADGIVGVMGQGFDFYPKEGTNVRDNQWHHIVASYGNGTLSIYVDGSKDTTTTVTDSNLPLVYDTQGQRNFIGKNNHEGVEMYFSGKIDEVAIWKDALLASEIISLYNSGVALDAKKDSASYNSSDDLVAYYKMEEGSGNTLADLSGFGNNGTLNGPDWSSGTLSSSNDNTPKNIEGGSLSFDGQDDFIDLTSSNLPIQGDSPRTISAWVKASGDGRVVSTGMTSQGKAFNLVISDSIVGVMGQSFDFYPKEGTNVRDNQWHHIVASYSRGSLSIYVDGSKDTTTTVTLDGQNLVYDTQGQRNFIGKNNHEGAEMYFGGKIDEVAIWRNALSENEIKALYNSGIALDARKNFGNYSSSNDLVAYYKMEEGSGNTITDLSGYGNNGTLVGPSWTSGALSASRNNVANLTIPTYTPVTGNVFDGVAADNSELDLSNAKTTLSAYWNSFDSSKPVIYYYAVGTSVSNNIVDWKSNGNDTTVTVSGLNLQSDSVYYFSIYGVADQKIFSDTIRTDGILIDNTAPVISSVYDANSSFINKSIQFEGIGSNPPINLTDNNLFQEFNGPMTVEFWIKHNKSDNSDYDEINAISGRRFYIMVDGMSTGVSGEISLQVDRGDGSYASVTTGENPILPFDTWTHVSVTRDQSIFYKVYINGNLKQTGQGFSLNDNSNEYNFGGRMGRAPSGSGNLDEIRFWNYARTKDDILAQMNKELTGDEAGLFGYWNFNQYSSSSVLDVTGNGNNGFVSYNNSLVKPYKEDTWQTDYSSSITDVDWYGPNRNANILVSGSDNNIISSYEFSIGTSSGSDDVVSWFKSDSSQAMVDLANLAENVQFYSNARIYDLAGNVSEVSASNGFKIDRTRPQSGSVSTGSNYQFDASSMEISWSGFSDSGSGIERFEYALGTQPGSGDVVSRANANLSESVNLNDLTLEDGVTYYASVFAVDSVGNESFASSSIIIDQSPPVIGSVIDGSQSDSEWSTSDLVFSASWSAFEDISGIDFYEVSIGDNKGSDNASRWQDIGNDTSYIFTGLDLQDGDRYYVNVRATDLLGNVSAVASSDGFTVDVSAPAISAISVQPNSTVPLFDDLSVELTLSEPILGVDVSAEVKIGLTPNVSYSLVDSTIINVTVAAPFTSGDQITFTIQNHTDRAGNVGITTNYDYDLGYLADYDLDGSIGVSDFSQFVTGWNNKDLAYEIGPVVGSAPNLRPTLDGEYNSQDGMAFYYMWHWDNSQAGKLATKALAKIGEDIVITHENERLMINPPKDVHGAEIIINYPVSDIKILPRDQDSGSNLGTSLSKIDTLSGQILSHILTKGKDISFNLDFNIRDAVTIQISYEFINADNNIVGSGYIAHKLVPIPTEFALKQNYPNPFNPNTTINYDLPKDAFVNIVIYDILGREIKSLVNQNQPAGYHSQVWNSKDKQGREVGAGIYFYQIQSQGNIKTRKMVLLK
ncbi:MAG: LamG-like jellyroll fold domain-containing protein [Candidatus Neomarinimicrobiota bacterium]